MATQSCKQTCVNGTTASLNPMTENESNASWYWLKPSGFIKVMVWDSTAEKVNLISNQQLLILESWMGIFMRRATGVCLNFLGALATSLASEACVSCKILYQSERLWRRGAARIYVPKFPGAAKNIFDKQLPTSFIWTCQAKLGHIFVFKKKKDKQTNSRWHHDLEFSLATKG